MTDSLAPLPALLERAAEMLCDIADGRKEIPTQAMYDLRVDLLVAASTRGSRRLLSPEGSDTPMQPLHVAPDGMLRFRVNPIVRFLLDNNGRGEYAGKRIDMNELACVDATDDEFAQFAELIGYSLGGYSELSYVTGERYAKAEAQKAALSQGNAALSNNGARAQISGNPNGADHGT